MTTPVAPYTKAEPAVFSSQEILEAAQYNVTAFILAAARDCRDRGLSFDEWADIIGRLFAPTWAQAPKRDPLFAARRMAVNWLSAGATDVAVAGDESRVEVTYRWPDDDKLAAFGVSRREVQTFPRFFAHIAEYLGLRFEYAVEGDRTRLFFAR